VMTIEHKAFVGSIGGQVMVLVRRLCGKIIRRGGGVGGVMEWRGDGMAGLAE